MYESHRKELRSILAELSFGIPHYDNVSWRLDVQVASRTLNKQVEPIFTIKLETLEPGTGSGSSLHPLPDLS